jgi:cysteine desulfurase/selenocysteine lyase
VQTQEQLISEFPIKNTTCYLNNASYTPMSRSAIDSITKALEEYSNNGPSDEYYLKLKEGAGLAREKLSKLIKAPKEQIIFTESATQSINLVANGLRLAPGDSIITPGGSGEHPSNFLPWRYYAERKKARIVDLKTNEYGLPDSSDLDSALKESRAKLVVMSHVLYNLGTIMPVTEACKISHERGALFFLDASQSVGNIPVNLSEINCDYAAGTAAKWLCGPLGLGFFYCKKEALEELDPLNFGPNACTYSLDGDYKPLDSAFRLQEGFRNWAYCFGLSAGIDLIDSIGLGQIREKDLSLADMIIEAIGRLKSFRFIGTRKANLRTCIIPLEEKAIKPIEVVQYLSKSNIIVAEREIGTRKILRISPHFYNDEHEVQKMLTQLGKLES